MKRTRIAKLFIAAPGYKQDPEISDIASVPVAISDSLQEDDGFSARVCADERVKALGEEFGDLIAKISRGE